MQCINLKEWIKETVPINLKFQGRALTSEDLFTKWSNPQNLAGESFLTIPYRMIEFELSWSSKRKARVSQALQARNQTFLFFFIFLLKFDLFNSPVYD